MTTKWTPTGAMLLEGSAEFAEEEAREHFFFFMASEGSENPETQG